MKILVVDADPWIGSHLAHLLDEVGYAPVVAQDAGPPLRRSGTRDIPIIVLSGMPSEEARLRGLEAGADDYVTKPYSTHELLACIRARLRRAYAFPFEEHEKCS